MRTKKPARLVFRFADQSLMGEVKWITLSMNTRLGRKLEQARRRLMLTSEQVEKHCKSSLPSGNGIGLSGRGEPMLIVWGKPAVGVCYEALCDLGVKLKGYTTQECCEDEPISKRT